MKADPSNEPKPKPSKPKTPPLSAEEQARRERMQNLCETTSYQDDLPPGTKRLPPYDPPEE